MNAIRNFITHHVFLFIIVVAVLFAGVAAVGSYRQRNSADAGTQGYIPRVTLATASDFRHDKGEVTTNGTVESLDQVEIKAQVNAPVESVRVKIGDAVASGQTLVVLKNSDIAAQLSQARAGYKAAEARLSELKSGARPEDVAISQLDLNKAQSDMAAVYDNAATALSDISAKLDGILRTQISEMFLNPDSQAPQLSFTVINVPGAQLQAESGRIKIKESMASLTRAIEEFRSSPNAEKADTALENAEKAISDMRSVLDALMTCANNASGVSNSVLGGYKANITAARGIITAAGTSLTGQDQAISAQEALIERYQNLLSIKKQGATKEQLDAAEAAVDQAAASVQSASAALEKTVIRAPISGKISVLPVRVGDLVTLGTPVVSIVNTKGLKVKAYVSSQDLYFIEEGAKAAIGEKGEGIVSQISPSIDPRTRKIEVSILISDKNSSDFVVGQYVDAKITPNKEGVAQTVFFLPLEAVKISQQGSFVYVVENGVAREIPVKTGVVEGEYVEVVEGIPDGTKIISSVRQVRSGDKVIVEE
jgi:HlyD family secretion protein